MKLLITTLVLHVVIFLTDAALKKPAGCGSTLGCYYDCESTCKFVITWLPNGPRVDFTIGLMLESGGSDQWIALGLSDDEFMGNDSVTECIMNGVTVDVAKSYNQGKSNAPLSDANEGLSNSKGSVTDGVLSCSYTQKRTSSNDQIFNLNRQWMLLVANGEASGGIKSHHSLDQLPAISPNKVDLQSIDDVSEIEEEMK